MDIKTFIIFFGEIFYSFVTENKGFALAGKRLCGIETEANYI